MFKRTMFLLLFLTIYALGASAQTTSPAPLSVGWLSLTRPAPLELGKDTIPPGSKVYIGPINGYESFLTAALVKKDVPIIVVNTPKRPITRSLASPRQFRQVGQRCCG